MQTLHIKRFHSHSRLPAKALAQRRRLDAVLRLVVDGQLETAVERAGVATDEEICIHSLTVPVRVRLSGSDAAIAAAWSDALGQAIRDAASGRVSHPREPAQAVAFSVVRYRSRAQAIVDVVLSVAKGDVSRAWAWRQLGLWQIGERVSEVEAVEEMVQMLAVREPSMIVAVLCAIVRRGLFENLSRRLDATHWQALAEAAVERTSGRRWSEVLSNTVARASSPWVSDESSEEHGVEVRATMLARAFAMCAIPRDAARAVAALVLLELDPMGAASTNRDEFVATLESINRAILPTGKETDDAISAAFCIRTAPGIHTAPRPEK